jgi:hypothetical protein
MSSKLIHHAAFLLLLFVLPGLVNVAAAANADPQPKDILTGIYKEAVKGNTAEWLDPKHRDKYLSKSLLRQWTRADKNKEEGDPLDWDLTTDTNALDLRHQGEESGQWQGRARRETDLSRLYSEGAAAGREL